MRRVAAGGDGRARRRRRRAAAALALAAVAVAFAPPSLAPAGAESAECANARALRLLRLPAYRDLALRCAAGGGGDKSAAGEGVTARGLDGGAKSAGDAPGEPPGVAADETYAAEAPRRPRAIYGRDDRIEAEQVAGLLHPRAPAIQKAVRATAALVKSDRLDRAGAGWRMRLEPYLVDTRTAWLPLCPDERFARQRKGAHCTVFLVSPTVMLTAGHCISFADVDADDPARNRYKVVFGFEMRGTAERATFKAEEVYDIARVIESRNEKGASPSLKRDYAVIELDRPVPAAVAEPLRLPAPAGPAVDIDTPLGVIGHPSGLTKKVSFGVDEASIGRAREAGSGLQFRASLNTFHGNSGSPVLFYDAPDVVAGILVAGEEDFIEDPGRRCVRTAIYAEGQQCRQPQGIVEPCAEKVTKISAVQRFIPDP